MGAEVELPAAAWPWVVEARSESVMLTTQYVDDPEHSDDRVPALSGTRAPARDGSDQWGADPEHLDALLVALTATLTFRGVDPTRHDLTRARAEIDGDGWLQVTGGSAYVYGHTDGPRRSGDWGACSSVEVHHRDLLVVRAALGMRAGVPRG